MHDIKLNSLVVSIVDFILTRFCNKIIKHTVFDGYSLTCSKLHVVIVICILESNSVKCKVISMTESKQ